MERCILEFIYLLDVSVCICVYLCFPPPPTPPAPHWNETAEKTLGVLADEDNTLQQNSSSRNTSYSSAVQKEITLPSRLVYYINQDSESPYHVLDTKARHQQKHNKVGRRLNMSNLLPQGVLFSFDFLPESDFTNFSAAFY